MRIGSRPFLVSLAMACAVACAHPTPPPPTITTAAHAEPAEIEPVCDAAARSATPPPSTEAIGRGWVGRIVDVDTIPLRLSSIAFVAFRTSDEGWLGDDDGRLLHTLDGGKTFTPVAPSDSPLAFLDVALGDAGVGASSEHTARLEWIDEMRGVALRMPTAMGHAPGAVGRALATIDGGRTWTSSPLGVERVDFTDRVGASIWVHAWDERSPQMLRSRDGGATFVRLAKGGKCDDVSFVDEQHGWCVWMSSLFSTDDGGDTWTVVHHDLAAGAIRFDGVVRISRTVGWVRVLERGASMMSQTFVTLDEGKSWRSGADERLGDRPRGEDDVVFANALVLEGHARRLHAYYALPSIADAAKDPPIFDRRDLAPWRDGVVFHTQIGHGVVFDRAGAHAFTWRPTDLHGTTKEPLLGVASHEGDTVRAWTAHAFVASLDGGATWTRIAKLGCGTLRRVVVDRSGEPARLGDGAIAETMDGRILRAGSDVFYESAQPAFDRYDADVVEARRAGRPEPTSPTRCLLDAKIGSLRVSIVHAGCFHREEEVWTISWNASGARIEQRGEVSPTSPRSAAAVVRKVIDAMEADGPEEFSGSTETQSASATWSCGGAMQHAGFDAGGRETRLEGIGVRAEE